MKHKLLFKKIARLESINDQLLSERNYIDHLMRLIGFTEGLETVKLSAQELLEKEDKGLSFNL